VIHAVKSPAPTRSQFTLSSEKLQELLLHTLDLRDRVILELFAFCGLRREEVAELEIGRLDLVACRLQVFRKASKGRPRKLAVLPMPGFLAVHLRDYLGRRQIGFVFPGQAGAPHLSKNAINEVVRRAGARIGFKQLAPGLVHLNPHTLRHTFARRMKAKGMSWEAMARILGHADVFKLILMYCTESYEEIEAAYQAKMTTL